ncbi:protein GPR107-like isoform X1 [Limulus polyphemus]|uniref:Protein GPR107-like isoform X1 n=2 Tax=Limulus polyphemus TaxID=6850 RepID=A0ABM1BTF8_LIMPO|nr:protein GPR107-like isoform X1 [Limulus polyphemus]
MKFVCFQSFGLQLIFILFSGIVEGRKHHLTLTKDVRRYFTVSTFGFLKGGKLDVQVNELSFVPPNFETKFGFTLIRTNSDSVTPYLENHQDTCLLLDDSSRDDTSINIVSFILDLGKQIINVNCSQMFSTLIIERDQRWNPASETSTRKRRNIGEVTSDSYLLARRKREDKKSQNTLFNKTKDELPSTSTNLKSEAETAEKNTLNNVCSTVQNLPVNKTGNVYSFQFSVVIGDDKHKGLYSLYFHNCANYGKHMEKTMVNLTMTIKEENQGTYLSAGEMPLPHMYFGLSVVFFSVGCFWIYVIRKKKDEAFKIHYLMGLLVFLKSFSLLFHGINFYFIAREGFHIEAWAVLFYITHLLKGALLFITLVLIGTGWAFIKHILSDKEKKIFIIVIPLQFLANVAEIIMEESEEGEAQHTTWREVFILVDLLCCGAILFPVVWSIRHLQEASQTDGKAAMNLEKLKLFRHFYIMIVCYIYFTRIIVYLLKITVPFQYEWLNEFFRETATLGFFVLTGYNFRPTTKNPYFRLSQDDPELEMEEVITQTGLTEGISKSVRSRDPEKECKVSQREISHEFD